MGQSNREVLGRVHLKSARPLSPSKLGALGTQSTALRQTPQDTIEMGKSFVVSLLRMTIEGKRELVGWEGNLRPLKMSMKSWAKLS
jgi:hypothetical protein